MADANEGLWEFFRGLTTTSTGPLYDLPGRVLTFVPNPYPESRAPVPFTAYTMF